jgi:HD-like signal output (HDOD) protein
MANTRLADTDATAGAQTAQELEQFTRLISTELEGESLELPSFPEVALRVRKALGDTDIAIDEVVRMVSAEPSLAVRLLQLANSAALNPGGQRITVLRLAISRIGFNLARSATIAFAMSQMRRAEAWRGLERRFRELWEQSAGLASISHALAKRTRGVIADQAMLAGMLHAVGKLFVLTRVSRFPLLLGTPARYAEIERQWHAKLGRAILTRWDMSAEVVVAACDYDQAAGPRPGPADLRDVLFAAHHLGSLSPGAAAPDPAVFDTPPFQRLQLDAAGCAEVLRVSGQDIASLRAALID